MTPGNQGIQALDVSIHGVGVNHGNITQYMVGENATPEQKIEAARENLRAGMRERAEQLIDAAIDGLIANGGTASPEALYYRALSLVSRRSPEDLTDEDWHKLRHALDRLTDDSGQYGSLGRVLYDVMRMSLRPSRPGAPGARPDVAPLLDGLPVGEIGNEFKDHLRYVVRAIERDALDSEEEGKLDERVNDERVETAPLFFTPDPVLHRPHPPAEPKLDPGIVLVGCVMGVIVAVVGLITQISDDIPDGELTLAAVLITLGCVALAIGVPELVRTATERARRREWKSDPDGRELPAQQRNPFRRQGARLGAVLLNRNQWREDRERRAKELQKTKKAAFRRTVEAIVQDRFLEYEPKGSEPARQWRRHTERPRQDLIDELTHRHWRTGTPSALDWLIQLRVNEIGERSRDHKELAFVERTRRFQIKCLSLGVTLLFFGVLWLIPSQDSEQGFWSCLVLIISLLVMLKPAVHHAKVRAHRRDLEQYQADDAERRAWQDELKRNRPKDRQMALWYDLDQRHLRREVLAEHRMEHRDILFSFFLVEGAPGCVRAKIKDGPPRYSQYRQTFYVLTSSGVWVSSWNVDSTTGTHDGRQDTVFRYDAISSVTVESVGVRFGDSLREIVSVSESGALRDAADEDDLVLHEALRLVLHNGQRMTALLENYEQLYDATQEDRGQLRSLALETSGITAGFRILTAMATEGRKWFEQRRQRSYEAFVAPE
ncbi:hypothetical protein SGFS_061180 [Streptomyces graminofaciens]|uniref:DUF2207 domain-containing protein n=1 Tax=Streptomyces graminofaciens TaxID=68212 RepID=A0ABM7FF31_9ACTN|nr:hypothetical protein [Streptomyces graminofaciens]BBC34824.1 hypothetical protein SGFS_061180 [Streptomyces graminofaciens]